MSRLSNFILILSGSLAGWIDNEFSSNTGYLGREMPAQGGTGVTDTYLRLDESVVIGRTTWIAMDAIYKFGRDTQRSVPDTL